MIGMQQMLLSELGKAFDAEVLWDTLEEWYNLKEMNALVCLFAMYSIKSYVDMMAIGRRSLTPLEIKLTRQRQYSQRQEKYYTCSTTTTFL